MKLVNTVPNATAIARRRTPAGTGAEGVGVGRVGVSGVRLRSLRRTPQPPAHDSTGRRLRALPARGRATGGPFRRRPRRGGQPRPPPPPAPRSPPLFPPPRAPPRPPPARHRT